MVELSFAAGTIEVRGADADALPAACRWDDRTRCHRAPAVAYADIVRALHTAGIDYRDDARGYATLAAHLRVRRQPRPYQAEALAAWVEARGRGVVVLPTGAGKTHVAVMAIAAKARDTLIVAPTLDLVRQWYDVLRMSFAPDDIAGADDNAGADSAGSAPLVGVIGGGEYQLAPLTVTTYDSAYIHMEHIGARFGLVVFDECHHLPGPSYAVAAQLCLAPFRLGLTATPERADGRDMALDELIGPQVLRRQITEMAGQYLADYDTEHVEVELSPDERRAHDDARAVYLGYLRRAGLRVGEPGGWSEFIMRAAQSEDGRAALDAYRLQRHLAFAASAKMAYVEHLLHVHRGDRAIVFTDNNATCYEVSRRFLIPAITHQTKITERSAILAGLADGTFTAVVTSKVLNEGVDVPSARVAIVMSGSGSVREHVQRLGRVLRKQAGKRAVLYELVTAGTAETFTSERRRDHVAYQ